MFGRVRTFNQTEREALDKGDATLLLSTDNRPFVFCLGPESNIEPERVKSDPRAFLNTLGYIPEYLQEKFDEGKSFALVLFEPEWHAPATWDGAAELIDRFVPAVSPHMRAHLPEFKARPFSEWESRHGRAFFEHLKTKESLLTEEQLLGARRGEGDLVPPELLRLFLYCRFKFLEQFTGDGHTSGGVKEFLAENIIISPKKHTIIRLFDWAEPLPD